MSLKTLPGEVYELRRIRRRRPFAQLVLLAAAYGAGLMVLYVAVRWAVTR